MADSVPNIASSAAQAGYVQAETARARDATRAGQSQIARKNAQAIDKSGSTISTDDDDTQIYAESEGTGGQGREGEAAGRDSADDSSSQSDEGLTVDEQGREHLDLEA